MTSNSTVGRFAPSPTGALHPGSVLAALASYLDARAAGGRWHVRIDDLDSGRCRAEAREAILRGLETLGLHWDGPVQYQSQRRDVYEQALGELRAGGLAYPCGCTRREVAASGRRGPAGMIYPGTCRKGLPAGRKPRSWRFAVASTRLAFGDRHAGEQSLCPAEAVGDFVIRRADGLHAYHLAMVLDDAELGVTDVVRGGDLLAATFPQLALQQALGLARPRYLHLPVAVDGRGRKLSKTNGATGVDRRHPGAVLSAALRLLGQSLPPGPGTPPAAEVLDWALRHWQPARIPQRSTVPV